ncbi:hypothetical protein [Streptomyces alanosinicus]|uniref:Secreted protein n=1 Tax=Streptomyces alanosinicus TaxID=68171 RepID=A0A918YR43_9ACTN|nr:hypothetical protein [Streptomyces alanosinicus]GHE12617.1 hypothetical protein GCM10010339_76540 [Streptomyces alanosinicus]
MPKHRATRVLTARRVSATATAAVAAGLTGLLGFASAAHAETGPSSSNVTAPADTFDKENFNRIMHEPLDQFAQDMQAHNPTLSNDRVVDGDGIRWDTTAAPTPPANSAAATRKSQQQGKISEAQELGLGGGAGVGSHLPGSVNGLPAYDGSTGSPFSNEGGGV